MLMGHTISMQEQDDSDQVLLEESAFELDDCDEEADVAGMSLYTASFEELSDAHLQYDTIIWMLIALLLVLAWGVGIIMFLYLPVRRSVLKKDISSRKLYVTANEIVYKVSRPSFLPFMGYTKIEKHIRLSSVIDIIIEQGCLQSGYGIHTFRVEYVSHGKTAPVDELQVQGITKPALLKKVIIAEACKSIQMGRSWRHEIYSIEGESTPKKTISSLAEASAFSRSPSVKVVASPRYIPTDPRYTIPSDLLLHKLDEVNRSVRRIESLIEETSNVHPGSD